MMKNRRTAPAKPVTTKAPAEQVVKDIRRATRKLHSSEEKIRIVLSGARGQRQHGTGQLAPLRPAQPRNCCAE